MEEREKTKGITGTWKLQSVYTHTFVCYVRYRTGETRCNLAGTRVEPGIWRTGNLFFRGSQRESEGCGDPQYGKGWGGVG